MPGRWRAGARHNANIAECALSTYYTLWTDFEVSSGRRSGGDSSGREEGLIVSSSDKGDEEINGRDAIR